jgi:PAS domain S-box-containing protein
MNNRRPTPWRLWLAALLFGGATILSAKLGVLLSVPQSTYVSFWLPAGIYLGVLLLYETRDWPLFVIAAIVSNFLFDFSSGTAFATNLGFGSADTLEALAGAWLVRRFVVVRPELATLKEFLGLLGYGAILSPVVGATIGAATLVGSGISHHFWASWITWWSNSAIAILLVTPLMLVWFNQSGFRERFFTTRGKILEAALLTAVLVGFSWYLLVIDTGVNGPYKPLLMLLLLWAGLRFGLRGATAASFLLALLIAFFTTHFLKGLTPADIATGAYLVPMRSFLMMSVIIVLIPTIVVAERDLKVVALEESEERFRRAFNDAPIGMSLVSLEGRWLKVNQVLCRMVGYSESELLQSDFQHVTHPDDLQKDLNFVRQVLAGEIPSYQMEKRYLHKNGAEVPVMLSVSLVHDRIGKSLYFVSQIENITERKQREGEREKLIGELQQALSEVKALSGMLPICGNCKKIRDDQGYWNQIETYIAERSNASFSHGFCPDCSVKFLEDAGLDVPEEIRKRANGDE